MKKHIVFLTGFLVFVSMLKAQVTFKGYEHLFTDPLHYTVYTTTDAISTDGKLNEGSWNLIPWSQYFTDIEGDKKPAPAYRTRFKMLWDRSNVYIAAEIEDTAIWANLTQRDAIVFLDNDFEIFIDPDGDSHNYFEIEVNALKTIFDLFLSKPYRNYGSALINWNVESLQVGVDVDGTINKPGDADKKWTVEMAIPFRSISVGNNVQIPQDNSIWRINFSRVEWDTDVVDGVYRKKTDAQGRNLPEHNWVWSPQGVIDMHYPERWGYIQFISGKPTAATNTFQLPTVEDLKKLLWLIYYKQMNHFKTNQKFTNLLNSLDFPSPSFESNGHKFLVQLEATTNLFEATIKDDTTAEAWQINQEGRIRKVVK